MRFFSFLHVLWTIFFLFFLSLWLRFTYLLFFFFFFSFGRRLCSLGLCIHLNTHAFQLAHSRCEKFLCFRIRCSLFSSFLFLSLFWFFTFQSGHSSTLRNSMQKKPNRKINSTCAPLAAMHELLKLFVRIFFTTHLTFFAVLLYKLSQLF